MAKLDLRKLADLEDKPSTVNNINLNSEDIEEAIENTLSRDGTHPNHMDADLDMNSNDILNINILNAHDVNIRGLNVSGVLTEAAASAEEADAAASAASAHLEDFKGRWLGGQASDPTVDLNGDALTAGDAYFNTTTDTLRVYTGSAWQAVGPYGTAAERDVQTSTTDTTAERVMQVGAFGLGNGGWNYTSSEGLLADIPMTRFYAHSGGAAPSDAPFGGQGVGLQISGWQPGRADAQLHFKLTTDETQLFVRARSLADPYSYLPWHEVYHQDSILGTVSQSSGVPTGAIIERDSNANGEYVRFADGTQICWHTLNSNSSADVTWTYPAEFSAAPSCNVSPREADRVGTMGATTPTTTSMTFRAFILFTTPDIARSGVSCSLLAVGRWY